MERIGLNKLCILRKTINVKNVKSLIGLSGVLREHQMKKIGCYFVIIVSEDSNI
jgi:hypothetical protein